MQISCHNIKRRADQRSALLSVGVWNQIFYFISSCQGLLELKSKKMERGGKKLTKERGKTKRWNLHTWFSYPSFYFTEVAQWCLIALFIYICHLLLIVSPFSHVLLINPGKLPRKEKEEVEIAALFQLIRAVICRSSSEIKPIWTRN